MNKINIRDGNFAHHPFSCADGKKASHFEWSRENVQYSKTCFLTDLHLKDVDKCNAKVKVAWLIEPPAINPGMYEWVKTNNKKFDYVLTFDKGLLERGENYLFYPFGVSWIKETDVKWTEQTKHRLCSMIASDKKQTVGHQFRQGIIQRLSGVIDHYGRGFKYVDNKEDALEDYMFSIVIENSRSDYYFSEKLIDCFECGTIPIYWGMPSINKFFDMDGIITFETIDELEDIVRGLTPDMYERMKGYGIENYCRTTNQNLRIPEDWLYEKYPWLFTDENIII